MRGTSCPDESKQMNNNGRVLLNNKKRINALKMAQIMAGIASANIRLMLLDQCRSFENLF